MTNLKFFSCDGGPHLLLPNTERNHWGTDHPVGVLEPASDYMRACRIEPPFGLIDVGGAQALVLAGNPSISGWEISPNQRGIDVFVFEHWSVADLNVLRSLALAAQGGAHFIDTYLQWNVPEGGVTLMFAGDHPGETAYGEESIPMEGTTHRIMRGSYEDTRGKVMILRIVPK
jgi:hypothetical protein